MDKKENFYNLLRKVFISGLSSIRKYQKDKKIIFSHHDFPTIHQKFFAETFPMFGKNDGLDGPKNYNSIFESFFNESYIKFNTLNGALEYKKSIKEDDYLRNFFWKQLYEKSDDNFEFLDFKSEKFVTNMLNIYIHKYKTFYYNHMKFENISKKYVDCIFGSEAKVNIYVQFWVVPLILKILL